MKHILLIALLVLAACAETTKDYDASAHCQTMGHMPGTKAYDVCMDDEKVSRMLEQQQQEMDMLHRDRLDNSLRRY